DQHFSRQMFGKPLRFKGFSAIFADSARLAQQTGLLPLCCPCVTAASAARYAGLATCNVRGRRSACLGSRLLTFNICFPIKTARIPSSHFPSYLFAALSLIKQGTRHRSWREGK